MTEHDSPDPHPVDNEMTAALRAAAATVPKNSNDTLDAARAARDHHAHRRHRRIRTVTFGAAAAVLLVVIGAALALGNTDPEPHTVASDIGTGSTTSVHGDAPFPIPLNQARDACPDRPVQREIFDASKGSSGSLLDFAPTEVIVCNYQGTEQLGGSVLIPADVERVTRDLAALKPVPDDVACTAEAGPTVGLIAADGDQTETVWLQLYGCGLAFNGDHNRIGAKSLSWLTGQEPATPGPNAPSMSAPHDDSSSASPVQPTTSVQKPAPVPTPPDQSHDTCPAQPIQREVFDATTGQSGPLLSITPTAVTMCVYQGTELMRSTVQPTNRLDRITSELAALDPIPGTGPCPSDAGPTAGLVFTDGTRTETVWLQFYGCGLAFNGDSNRIGAKSLNWLLG